VRTVDASEEAEAVAELEEIKRLYAVGELTTASARVLDQFWRRKLCVVRGYIME